MSKAELSVPGLALRPATPADTDFLRALYRTVRDPELALTPWPEALRQQFSDSQFQLQDRHYRQHYPQACFWVVERAGQAIGRLYVNGLQAPDLPLELMDISLLPGERQAGRGTALIQALCVQADARGQRVRLYVEVNNPARRLYGRLGFADDAPEGPYLRMYREPRGGAAPVTGG